MEAIRVLATSLASTPLSWVVLPDVSTVTASGALSNNSTIEVEIDAGSTAAAQLPSGPLMLRIDAIENGGQLTTKAPWFVVTDRSDDVVTGVIRLNGQDASWALAGGLVRPVDETKVSVTRPPHTWTGKTASAIMSDVLATAQSNGEALHVSIVAGPTDPTIDPFQADDWQPLDSVLSNLARRGASWTCVQDAIVVNAYPKLATTGSLPTVWGGRDLSDGQRIEAVSDDPTKVIAQDEQTLLTSTATGTKVIGGFVGHRATTATQSGLTQAQLDTCAKQLAGAAKPSRLTTTASVQLGLESSTLKPASELRPFIDTVPGSTVRMRGWDGTSTSVLVDTITITQDEQGCKVTLTVGDPLHDPLAGKTPELPDAKLPPVPTPGATVPDAPAPIYPLIVTVNQIYGGQGDAVQDQTDPANGRTAQSITDLGSAEWTPTTGHRYGLQVTSFSPLWGWYGDGRNSASSNISATYDIRLVTGVASTDDTGSSAYWNSKEKNATKLVTTTRSDRWDPAQDPGDVFDGLPLASVGMAAEWVAPSATPVRAHVVMTPVADTRLTFTVDSFSTPHLVVIDYGPNK